MRTDTTTASESLGTVPAFSPVQIIGRDVSGFWLRIIFNDGAGWVRADYVQVADASIEIPVWDDGTGSGSAERGVVLRGVNVRSGPGRDFEALGLLNQNDVVFILEKDSSGAWMKIEYPVSPDGTGWVAVEFLQIENVDAIPTLATTTQATIPQASETQTVSTPVQWIQLDGDSADAPLANFMLAVGSVRSAQFKGEVSAPAGDGEDRITFSSDSDDVVIRVSCESGIVKVELFPAGGTSNILEMACGDVHMLENAAWQSYSLRISPSLNGDSASAVYRIKIEILE